MDKKLESKRDEEIRAFNSECAPVEHGQLENNQIDLEKVFMRPHVEPSCYQIEEICARAGLTYSDDLLNYETDCAELTPISIPTVWMEAPIMKWKGKPNLLAASILAEVMVDRLRQARKAHYLEEQFKALSEYEEDMGPRIYSWHYEALSDEAIALERGFKTSLDILANRFDVDRAAVIKAFKCLEISQLVTVTRIHQMESDDLHDCVLTSCVEDKVVPNYGFMVDIVTPKLAEITLPDLCKVTSEGFVAEFIYRLAEREWGRQRGDGLRLTDTLQSHQNELDYIANPDPFAED